MAYGPRKKDELLEEYRELETLTFLEQVSLDRVRWLLEQAAETLATLADLAWIENATGTPTDRLRLHQLVRLLPATPDARELSRHVEAYERLANKPWSQRPRPEHWRQLAQEAVQVISEIVRRGSERLQVDREAYHGKRHQLTRMERRRDYLANILGDEIYADLPDNL